MQWPTAIFLFAVFLFIRKDLDGSYGGTFTGVESLTLQAGERIPSHIRFRPRPISTEARESLWNLPAVEQWASERGLKEHHLKCIYPLLLQLPLTNEDEARHLLYDELLQRSFPQQHAQDLLAAFRPLTCKILSIVRDDTTEGADAPTRTTKLVVGLSNGRTVETVLLEHRNRSTVCVSSQVGCARACSFCATGSMGLLSQLTSNEILEQVYLAQSVLTENGCETQRKRIRNVVFMGMGEPCDNYDEVIESCRGLTHQRLFGLPARHITISTVGASPRYIRALAQQAPTISLAVSLHGATQELREELLPSAAAAAKLGELKEALSYHTAATNRTTMLEYLLIAGVNDTPEALQALISFCHDQSFYINLIPYNPTAAGDAKKYEAPSHDRVQEWADTLRRYAKVHVRWSTMSGRQSSAACGQLVVDTIRKS